MDQKGAALNVWHVARASTGNVPDPARIRRVREKLGESAAELVMAERAGDLVGMVLVELFRQGEGMRTVRAGWGDISMLSCIQVTKVVGSGPSSCSG